MDLSAGQTISNYEILGVLGVGAAGKVYRARDTTLDRQVAIKVLPRDWHADEDLALRFDREAKTLAALNHPNVAQIYGVDQLDGTDFFVLELVEGEDLSERIARGPLPIDETLAICRQVAEGVEAAHELGIIHRDLKPANVRLTPQGVAKVLDFGLAKPLRVEPASTGTSSLTSDDPLMTQKGVLVGTPAYMSPEQVRGRHLDRRTDIWAFGCILYECLAGRRAYDGETIPDLFSAILDDEPDAVRLPPQTPGHLRELLARCLDKNARTRLQDMGEARIALERAPAPVDVAPRARTRTRIVPILVTAVLVAVAAVFATLHATRDDTPVNPLAGATFTTITTSEGVESDAAISPDGQRVAFLSDRDGQPDAWVGQYGSTAFRNLTQGELPLDTRWNVRALGFTPDGDIWLGGGPGRRMKFVSVITGESRNALGDTVVNPAWSPDGERVAFHTHDDGDPVYVGDRYAANSELIFREVSGRHQHFPVWSRDGHWIYFVGGRPATGDMDLWRMRPNGKEREQLTQGIRYVAHPTPLDERTVLFVGREENGAGPWLWAFDVESRTSRRVNIGPARYTSLAASDDGRRLVVSVANPRASLWRVPILANVATERDVTPYAVPAARAQAPRLRGETLFFLSSVSGIDGLWRHHGDEVQEIWKGAQAPLQAPPAISADGASVALVLMQEGKRRLRVLRADGTEPRDLSDVVDARGSASWSPDGRWLVAGGVIRGVSALFKYPVDGGPPERLVDGEAMNPVWSPRGDLILYAGRQVNAVSRLHAYDVEKGTPLALPEIAVRRRGERFRFLPDGSGFVYMQGLWASQDFWLYAFEGGQPPRRLTKLENRGRMRTFDVTADGRALVFDRMSEDSDIVLIDLR